MKGEELALFETDKLSKDKLLIHRRCLVITSSP